MPSTDRNGPTIRLMRWTSPGRLSRMNWSHSSFQNDRAPEWRVTAPSRIRERSISLTVRSLRLAKGKGGRVVLVKARPVVLDFPAGLPIGLFDIEPAKSINVRDRELQATWAQVQFGQDQP